MKNFTLILIAMAIVGLCGALFVVQGAKQIDSLYGGGQTEQIERLVKN